MESRIVDLRFTVDLWITGGLRGAVRLIVRFTVDCTVQLRNAPSISRTFHNKIKNRGWTFLNEYKKRWDMVIRGRNGLKPEPTGWALIAGLGPLGPGFGP